MQHSVRSTIVSDLHLHKMSKFIQNLSSQYFLQQSVSYEKPHFIQFSVSACESCTFQSVLLHCNGTKCTGNGLSIPAAACSQQLPREPRFTQVAISLLVWSGLFTPRYECIVTDLTVDNVVTHMQGFSSRVLIIFLLETVWNLKESWLMCGSCAWLIFTILVYKYRLYIDFRLNSLKCLNSQ